MMYFSIKNKEKKKNSRESKKIKDISPARGNQNISFKDKTWRIEFSKKDIKRFLKNNKFYLIYASGTFVLIFGIFGYFFFSRADVVDFYPSSCLGGWENPQNAQGKPDLEENADVSEFNGNNSAVLNNSISQIFCGGFEGQAPENSEFKKASLKFSLAVKTGNNNQGDNFPIETTSTTGEASSSASSTSFWNKIINLVFAEELAVPASSTEQNPIIQPTTTEATVVETTVTELATTTVPQSTSTENSTENISSIVEIAATSSESAISTSTEIISTSTATTTPEIQNPFLEVFYSLDGLNWNSLGKINNENWKNLSFEIPGLGWEDISKIQISVKSLSPTEFAPTVYLDGMWLEVEYGKNLNASQVSTTDVASSEVASGSVPSASSTVIDSLSADKKELKLEKIFDEKAKHSCSISPTSQEINKDGNVSYNVSLKPSAENKPYELILGGLPVGISGVINNSTAVFTADSNPQIGSFNIAVVYRETQDNGEIFSNFCQLNLVVKE